MALSVRVTPCPPIFTLCVAQSGRASALDAESRRFESCRADQSLDIYFRRVYAIWHKRYGDRIMNIHAQTEESLFAGIKEDTTVTFNQWLKSLSDRPALRNDLIVTKIEAKAGIYLRPHVIAWIDGPVAYVNGEIVQAESTEVSCLKEFKKDLEDTGDMFVMYIPIWNPPIPQYEAVGEGKIEYTGLSEGRWVIRGKRIKI